VTANGDRRIRGDQEAEGSGGRSGQGAAGQAEAEEEDLTRQIVRSRLGAGGSPRGDAGFACRLTLSKFTPGKRVCKACRAAAERERAQAERTEAAQVNVLDDEDGPVAEWAAKVRAPLPKHPHLDLEPGWLERMQAVLAPGPEAVIIAGS